jgi:hypothetical protein
VEFEDAPIFADWPVRLDGLVTTFPNDTVYGTKDEQNLPPASIWNTEIHNGTSQLITQTLSIGELVTTADTLTLSFTLGVATTDNFSFSIGYPPYFGSSFGGSDNFSFTRTTTQTQTLTKQRSWNYQVTVPIGPQKTVRVELVLAKSIISVPFDANIQVHGIVYAGSVPVALGKLFQVTQPNRPNPAITIIDDQTIKVKLSGTITGVIGTDLKATVSEINPANGQIVNTIELLAVSERLRL